MVFFIEQKDSIHIEKDINFWLMSLALYMIIITVYKYQDVSYHL